MSEKLILATFALISSVNCDWVKLPQITNTPKVNYKIQTVASFSDFSPSSILSNSDVLSSVFSYDAPKILSSTTEMSLITEATFSQPSIIKKFLPSTVTSKTIDFKPEVSDRIDHEEMVMEAINLVPIESNKKKVFFLNQTVAMNVSPLPILDSGKELSSNQETEEEDDEDDDGVTVVSEDENFDSSNESTLSDEEYEYEEDEPEIPSTTTTTTKAPRKARPSKPPTKPQRRVIQVASMKAKPHNHLNFTSFMKFLKNIQDSFATRTAKNINDKISMLRKFRDKLLLTVNQRIKSLWKTQTKTKKKKQRTKRTLGGGGGGGGWMQENEGMDFPSAESALLSISFLTFAVFLIKLVLQVIQTIKMKKMSWQQMNTMTVDPMQQGSVVLKRHRSTRKVSFSDPEDFAHYTKILNSIETLKV